MSVSIDVNVAPMLRGMARILGGLDDLTPLLHGVGMEMEARVLGRFETRTDPAGQPWAPWAESTRASYPRNGHGKLLDRYGDMLRGVSHAVHGNAVEIGFAAPHAAYHEFGTARMPRRGLLTMDPDNGQLGTADAAAVQGVVTDYLGSLTG